MDLKQESEAARFLTRATTLNPRCTDAWYDLGVTLSRLGQRKRARACFTKVLRSNAKYFWAYYDLAWLEAELRAVKPAVVVLLGATAAQSVMGPQFKLMQNRGTLFQTPGPAGPGLPIERIVATIHPSAVLRAPDADGRRAAYESLVADLKVVARVLRSAT